MSLNLLKGGSENRTSFGESPESHGRKAVWMGNFCHGGSVWTTWCGLLYPEFWDMVEKGCRGGVSLAALEVGLPCWVP